MTEVGGVVVAEEVKLELAAELQKSTDTVEDEANLESVDEVQKS